MNDEEFSRWLDKVEVEVSTLVRAYWFAKFSKWLAILLLLFVLGLVGLFIVYQPPF